MSCDLGAAVSALPSCYRTVAVHGFVEELVVDDDPEYGWVCGW
jgi:hypothetical protein